ncbi:MAG: SNF2-related protein [Phycisphaerae bacterium]|nr:SNF2-related protein [Phycisphaerae bacterium]
MSSEVGATSSSPVMAALASQVRPEVLQRGVWIAMRGDVDKIVTIHRTDRWPDPKSGGQRTRVEGLVEGTDRYKVSLDVRDDGRIACQCSCPYFADRVAPCKHIVAFILEGLRQRRWTWPSRTIRLDVERLRPALTPGTPNQIGGASPPQSHGRDQQQRHGHGRPQQPGQQHGPPLGRNEVRSAPQFVMGDAWRPTLAPPIPGAPPPFAYALVPATGGGTCGTIECYRRITLQSGATTLGLEPFFVVRQMELDPIDREIIAIMEKSDVTRTRSGAVDHVAGAAILALAAKAGRMHQRRGRLSIGPALRWKGDIQWSAEIHLGPDGDGAMRWARLVAPGESAIDCLQPAFARVGSLFVLDDSIIESGAPEARLAPSEGATHGWTHRGGFGDRCDILIVQGPQRYTPEEMPLLLDGLRQSSWSDGASDTVDGPELHVATKFGITYFDAAPIRVLRLDTGGRRATIDLMPLARYVNPDDEDIVVDRDPREHRIVDDIAAPAMCVPRGDRRLEWNIAEAGRELLRKARGSGDRQWRAPRANLPKLLSSASAAGFVVEMAKQQARAGGAWNLDITSGVDWFELNGALETADGAIPLSELVAAAKRNPDAIEILPLSDGTSVLVPEKLRAVLRKLAKLLARRDEDELRFDRSDVLILDSLLEAAGQPNDNLMFRELRDRLQSFETPPPLDPPAGFGGTLRDYQRHGLGWFQGLRQLGFGGCLADEMGLGKTVQVLAMLAQRRGDQVKEIAKENETISKKAVAKSSKKKTKKKVTKSKLAPLPSLIVVPRSIVRNWQDEAARFAPKLRVVDLTRSNRSLTDATFKSCDVAIMTYGTLLRDIERLAKRRFDYVILDEAQAIKNATSRTAKAAKCLVGNHRLAMTGTPIENHLGELWSLMSFLNPGLGQRLEKLAGTGDADDLELVRKSVRPFLLRRTKQEVAKDLPERIEQTILCDMTEDQREHYETLRARIRAELLGTIDAVGFGKAQMQVLEGLLRLRQIACHPVLADKRRGHAGSGKLEALMPMLEESAEEGRKTLVFSQFTSFLALVKKELDDRGIVFEYLDGKTRDRADRVKRFATDAGCSVFLLSLKAGGVGLNLQAAERVVLLDPWWNPAVEAQAIDRAHRIGQTRTVHAMRLVSAGTIEERVLTLQQKKRAIADAIVAEDAGPLGSMTKDDLKFLLDATPTKKVTKTKATKRADK